MEDRSSLRRTLRTVINGGLTRYVRGVLAVHMYTVGRGAPTVYREEAI